MKYVAIGIHLHREDVEPVAEAVPAGGLFVSAATVADDQPMGDRDLLLRVARLRSELLSKATFIAVRYGWSFRAAVEAESKVIVSAERWRSLLTEHRDRVEMTLKVAAAQSKPRPDRHEFQSGAGYMRALHDTKMAAGIDPAFREAADRLVGAVCVRSEWMTRDATSLELAGLLDRGRLEELKGAGEQLKVSYPSVPFLMSAPWPLEVFADADRQ